MKSPLRVGAVAAPKRQFPFKPSQPQNGKARRIASLSAVVAIVLGVGAASAIFVDYLADRALARAAEAPAIVKPVVAKAVVPEAAKVAALVPQPEAAPAVQPAETQVAALTPDAAAIARVAVKVGPEHAIEEPTDDPTASPILHLEEVSASEDVLSVDESVPNEEPIAADEDEGSADETLTAAIAPDEAEAVLDEQPKKPKRQKAAKAKPAVAEETDVASLPGVDIGGLAGHPSDENDNSGSTVRTVTKPAAKNLGGVAAGTARVTAAVNLRSSPRKGSSVAMVVPAGSAVNVLSCDGWCQVVYNGKKGWVYKSFLTGSKAKPQKAANSASADAPTTRKTTSSRL